MNVFINTSNIVCLVLGDWSHDGHSKTSNIFIKSNFTLDEIEKLYHEGVAKLGIDLIENVCTDYEDNVIRFEDLKKFIDAGFYFKINLNNNFKLNKTDIKTISNQEDLSIDIDFFVELYLFTVYIGNNDFKFKFIEDPSVSLNIGGYGLFEDLK